MLDGAFEHEDNQGHRGIIKPGDLQWMTAGKGIVHAEMPVGKDEGHGLQLWVNLAAKDKMVEPAYQELLSKDIPKVKHDGVTGKRQAFDTPLSPPTLYLPAAPPPPPLCFFCIHHPATVIAGSAFGVTSPVYTRTPTCYLDFTMEPKAKLQQLVPAGWNGFVYVISGSGSFGPSGKVVCWGSNTCSKSVTHALLCCTPSPLPLHRRL